jgi:Acyl-CoA thioesterase C-terminal domain/Acyl-CoA thioesterase N-terminal domain
VKLDTTRVERRSFAAVSALVPNGAGHFEGDVDPGWTIGGKPNGGYLLAMLGRAATWSGPHDHVVAASAHYVAPPEPGPVTVETEVLRAGRSATQVRARMVQGGRSCIESLITASHLEADTTPYWDRGVPEVSRVDDADCVRFVPDRPGGLRIAILEQVEVCLEPGPNGTAGANASGKGELRGWLGLSRGEAFDPVSLLFAVDSFPPATIDIEFSGWVPTLELTVYVRALPATGPVRILQRAQLIDGGRVDEACFVWDRTGRLVAQGTQLAGIRIG